MSIKAWRTLRLHRRLQTIAKNYREFGDKTAMGSKQKETVCCHVDCKREDSIWIPINQNNHLYRMVSMYGSSITQGKAEGRSTSDIIPHPYCVKCGVIKNLNMDDSAKPLGYWLEGLNRLVRRRAITHVQRRLITQQLLDEPYFADTYAVCRSAQTSFFVENVSSVCSLSSEEIESALR